MIIVTIEIKTQDNGKLSFSDKGEAIGSMTEEERQVALAIREILQAFDNKYLKSKIQNLLLIDVKPFIEEM